MERLNGVVKVENGFLNGKEINRVWYHPELTSIDQMKSALIKAGTYNGMPM